MIKDETAFMQKSGDLSPITDGLIYWFDAIDLQLVTTSRMECDDRAGGLRTAFSYSARQRYFKVEDGYLRYKALNSSSLLGTTTTPIDGIETVEVLIENTTHNFPFHSGDGTSESNYRLGLYRSGSRITYPRSSNVSPNNFTRYDGAPTTGKLHIVGTFEGSKSIIYINGDSSGCVSIDNTYRCAGKNIFNASNMATDQEVSIAIVRFYDRALSAEEILHNYNYEQSIGRVD